MPPTTEVLLPALFAFLGSTTLGRLLGAYGYLAVFAMVGAESMGVPMPGETMLEAAGVYAGTTHKLNIWTVWIAAASGAIVGDNLGYLIGRIGGFRLLLKWGHYVRLDESRLKVGKYLFMTHGGRVVFFGRFVSVLRAYSAFLAGANAMRWPRFLLYNALGGILWSSIYAFAAYNLGAEMTKLSAPVDYTLTGTGILVIIGTFLWLRKKAAELEVKAEAAFPGPLRLHLNKPGGATLAADGTAASLRG